MKILVLDNYDSFTYNLVHYTEQVSNAEVHVFRNDKIDLHDVEEYDKILLSPGPGLPSEAGIMIELIRKYAPHKSILGVCLGHQAIAEAFGASLYNLSKVYHGVATTMQVLQSDVLFRNMPEHFTVGRYHSWVVNEKGLPHSIEILAKDTEGEIMALRHKIYDVKGVQFHPESVLTEHGLQLINNWVNEPVVSASQQ
jgi:anthranilate synthase component 2